MGQECGRGSWKRLNFCGSRSTLKKEVGSGSKLNFMELEADAKNKRKQKYSTASTSLFRNSKKLLGTHSKCLFNTGKITP